VETPRAGCAKISDLMSVPTDLRATSDELLRDLEALGVLEDEKRTLPLDDPRLVEIAEQVEAIAARVLAGSERQTILSRAAADEPASGSSIDAVHRPLSTILAEWREVERRAATVPEGSAEAAEIEVLASRLRREYRETVSLRAP
jgi:hypothetical protein